jgi:hypothetical protein
VTAPAILKRQVAAKRAIAIVTTKAGAAARRNKMFERRGRADLARLRQSRRERVTVGASESLTAAMFRMAERVTISARIRSCSRERLLVMTNAAGSNLSS